MGRPRPETLQNTMEEETHDVNLMHTRVPVPERWVRREVCMCLRAAAPYVAPHCAAAGELLREPPHRRVCLYLRGHHPRLDEHHSRYRLVPLLLGHMRSSEYPGR